MTKQHDQRHAGASKEFQMTDEFLAHAMTPANVGIIPHPDGYANPTGSCGDNIELYLRVQDEVITDARFMTDGCIHTIACASALTSLIKGKTVSEAANFSYLEVEAEVGGLPEDHLHCATLAEGALNQALQDYYQKRSQPWKKTYSKT